MEKNKSQKDTEQIKNYFKVIEEVLPEYIKDTLQLKEAKLNEKKFIDFGSYSTSFDNSKIANPRLKFISDIIQELVRKETGLSDFFVLKEKEKKYENELMEIEEERAKYVKLREVLLEKLTSREDVRFKKYVTLSQKLEQELIHIGEFNFKRKLGHTISPAERNNLIRIEKEIENDKEWREVLLSEFLKVNSDIVYKIRNINKYIEKLLFKQGEISFYLNEISHKKNEFQINQNSEKINWKDVEKKIIEELKEFFNSIDFSLKMEEFNPDYFSKLISLFDNSNIRKWKKIPPVILFLPFPSEGNFFSEKNIILYPALKDTIKRIKGFTLYLIANVKEIKNKYTENEVSLFINGAIKGDKIIHDKKFYYLKELFGL